MTAINVYRDWWDSPIRLGSDRRFYELARYIDATTDADTGMRLSIQLVMQQHAVNSWLERNGR